MFLQEYSKSEPESVLKMGFSFTNENNLTPRLGNWDLEELP